MIVGALFLLIFALCCVQFGLGFNCILHDLKKTFANASSNMLLFIPERIKRIIIGKLNGNQQIKWNLHFKVDRHNAIEFIEWYIFIDYT